MGTHLESAAVGHGQVACPARGGKRQPSRWKASFGHSAQLLAVTMGLAGCARAIRPEDPVDAGATDVFEAGEPLDGAVASHRRLIAEYGGCAIRNNGHVLCWGFDPRAPRGEIVPRRYEVEGIDDAEDMVAMEDKVCVRSASRGYLCWGQLQVLTGVFPIAPDAGPRRDLAPAA